jgi:hypothetical protein
MKKFGVLFAIVLFAFTVFGGSTIIKEFHKIYIKDTASSNKIGLLAPSLGASWNATLPTDDGISGQVLRTDGLGVLSWVTPSAGSPGGANTQIQFNDSSAFGGDSALVWNKTSNFLGINVTSPASTFQIGPDIQGAAQVKTMSIEDSTTTTNANLAHFDAASNTARSGFILSNSGTSFWHLNFLQMMVHGSGYAGGLTYPNPGQAGDNGLALLLGQGTQITNMGIGTYDAAPLYLMTGNTVRQYINGAGNIAIGHTSPGSLLDVKGEVRISGSSSGYVGINVPASPTSYTVILPSAQGAASTVLTNNGSGTLSWTTPASGGGSTTTLSSEQIAMKAYWVANQTTTATITIDAGSQGGIYDGKHLFLSHQTPTAKLTKIDTYEGVVVATSTNANLSQPMGMAFDGVNLWVAEGGSNYVSKFKASDLSFVANVTTTGCPNRAMVFDGTYIWSGNDCASQVKRIKVSDSLVTSFTIGGTPNYLAFDGTHVWASYGTATNNIQKINPADGTIAATYSVGNFPRSLTFDGTNMWATIALGASVSKIKASDGTVLGTFSTGSLPYGATFDGTHVWVINSSANTISKVKVSDGTVIGSYPIPSGSIDAYYDGRGVWAVSYSGTTMQRVF